MDKPLNIQFESETMDIFTQEDAAIHFLAGDSKDDSIDDLLLSPVDNDNDDIEFKRDNILECDNLEESVLEDSDLNGDDNVKNEKSVMVDFKEDQQNSLDGTLKTSTKQSLNKMHVMEDVQEGSDVPGAQPSSPGHAEQRPDLEEDLNVHINNDNSIDSDEKPSVNSPHTNGTDETKLNIQDADNGDINLKNDPKDMENDAEKTGEDLSELELKDSALELESGSLIEDAGSNDSTIEETQYSKRKLDIEESSVKRIRSDLEQNFILRDKILNEYIDTAGCTTVQQIQSYMDQILSEIRTLNELASEKEKEWNNIIHLKKIKEELLLRMQRRKQNMILSNDKMDWNDHEASSESQNDSLDDRLRHIDNQIGTQKTILKHNANANNSGLVIFSTNSSGQKNSSDSLYNKQKNSLSKQLPNTIIEINGQAGDLKQNRQRPVIDVQSIIADYRQRHPEVVPRRGRRIRPGTNPQGDCSKVNRSGKGGVMSFSSISLGSGAHVKHNLNATGIESNSELGLLLTAVDNSQSRSDNCKSTFSPTLARLLTAPERASSSSPHANNMTPVSISDMLSNNKARNEITITPVGGQFDLSIKDKAMQEEEEAEDSADRLVIDESEALDSRNRMDNGSDVGDEVPQCQGCNQKSAQFVCAGCGNQWYCSRECQVEAWDEHSEVCSG